MLRLRTIPSELWFFAVGFAAYSAAPLLPAFPYVPANPVGIVVVAATLNLMRTRDRKGYWVTHALAYLAVGYPLLVLPAWLGIHPPGLSELLWVFVTPALLICLLRAPGVRRFVDSESEPIGLPES